MAEISSQYYSGNQASIFIGDVWVDDVTAIDYTVQHSRSPQYGYGSQHFDFVPKGMMLVTGSFNINFREPNYLWIILDRYREYNETNLSRTQRKEKEDARFEAETYIGDQRDRVDYFFNSTKVDKARDKLIAQSREFDGISEAEGKENFNHRAFNIVMGYGYELNKDSPGETIQSIHIMGKSKIINADGRPIAEQYNFIARKIV